MFSMKNAAWDTGATQFSMNSPKMRRWRDYSFPVSILQVSSLLWFKCASPECHVKKKPSFLHGEQFTTHAPFWISAVSLARCKHRIMRYKILTRSFLRRTVSDYVLGKPVLTKEISISNLFSACCSIVQQLKNIFSFEMSELYHILADTCKVNHFAYLAQVLLSPLPFSNYFLWFMTKPFVGLLL